MRLAAISVDLDSLPHYCRIHGLPEGLLDERARRLVYSVALERYGELFSQLSAPATYFAIGEDLEDEAAFSALRAASAAGVEIASHSYHHDYALSRRPEAEISTDLRRAHEAIVRAVGKAPVGFRAPGYTLSRELLSAVRKRGYRYDSSVFPAAPYYLAKAAVMGLLRAAGRPSRAILDSPRVLGAPRRPYFPDETNPYREGQGQGLLELPVAVTPGVRFPFIGTFAVSLPRAAVRTFYRQLRGEPFFNFELHAIDVLDAGDGVPPALARHQRDLNVPWARKMTRLREVFSWLSDDFELVTLSAAAERLVSRATLGDFRGGSYNPAG
ncbi:MAG: polysaccharide deacetylase family protein [Myxococcota bacterium]